MSTAVLNDMYTRYTINSTIKECIELYKLENFEISENFVNDVSEHLSKPCDFSDGPPFIRIRNYVKERIVEHINTGGDAVSMILG